MRFLTKVIIGVGLIGAVGVGETLYRANYTSEPGLVHFEVSNVEEALILDDDGDILRVVGPGNHVYYPDVETLLKEDVQNQRESTVNLKATHLGCAYEITVHWSISDLSKFHSQNQRGKENQETVEHLIWEFTKLSAWENPASKPGGDASRGILWGMQIDGVWERIGVVIHRVEAIAGECL